jgi:hypothetical protein
VDYYIPLPKLLPTLPVGLLNVLGPSVQQFASRVGVRRVREVWNDTHCVLTGELVVRGEFSAGPFVIGTPGDGTSEFGFELVTDRMSLLHHALAAGEGAFVPGELPATDSKVKAVLAADGPPLIFRLRLHLPTVRLRPDKDKFILGDLVMDPVTNQAIRIVEKPGSPPLDLLLADISLNFDSDNGFIPDWDDLDVELLPALPPFVWRQGPDRSFGFDGTGLRLDLSRKKGVPEVLGRPGFTEEWMGLYVERLRLFGLDQVFYLLPSVLELSEWILGFNEPGFTGRADFVYPRPAGDTTLFRLERLSVEIDRGSFVLIGADVSFYVDRGADGPPGDLSLTLGAAFRDAPEGGWAGELTLRTRPDETNPLSLPESALPLMLPLASTVALMGGIAFQSSGAKLASALLGVSVALQVAENLTLKKLAITRFTSRIFTTDVGGRRVKFVDIVLDFHARIALDLSIVEFISFGAIPRIATPEDQPLGIELREFTFRICLGDVPEVPKFEVLWPGHELTFSNIEQLALGECVVAKLGLGSWEQGIWVDLGIKMRDDRGGSGISAFVLRLFFSEPDGWALHDATIENGGGTFSLLIPEVLYVQGALQWLDGLSGSLRAFVIGNGSGSPDEYKERESWVWEIAATLAEKKAVDAESGTEFSMLAVTGDFETKKGLPLLCSGTSAYGLSAQYVQNARPALDPAHSTPPDYGYWFMDLEPRYRLDASKWTPSYGANGFGAGLALGSAWDGGRAWKIKGGALVQTGPIVIVHARGDVLGPPPQLDDPPSASRGFAAAVVWDGVEDQLTVDFRYEKKLPGDGKILDLSAPLKVFADFNDASQTYVHIGQHWPFERRVRGLILKSLDLSFYAMLDARGIQDLAGHSEVDVPPTAIALGVGGRWEKGLKKGKLRCYFRLIADANIVFSIGNPDLLSGVFVVDGGVGLKVYGLGFELHVYADLAWLLGRIWGHIGVKIGLPWPLPDIKAEIPFGMGDQSALPEPSAFTPELSMTRSGSRETTRLSPGASFTSPVPIDAWFSLAFAYPTRSAAATTSFVLSNSDVTTAYVASEQHEYIFDLEQLTLWKGDAGTGTPLAGPFAALWRAESVPAAIGKAASRVLHLLTWDQIDARHVGPSAEYLDQALQGFDPCAEPPQVQPVCFGFHGVPLGPLASPTTLTAATGQRVQVETRSPDFPAEIVLRRGTLFAQPAEVVASPIPIGGTPEPHVLRLPALLSGGGGTADDPSLRYAAHTLILRYGLAALAFVQTIAAPRQGKVVVRFYRGDELVHEDAGTPFGSSSDGFERRYHYAALRSTRAELVAEHWKWGASDQNLPHLVSACFVFQSDLDQNLQQAATQAAWSSFWSDLLGTGNALQGGQLLEPKTHYTLEVGIRWRRRDPTTGNEEAPSPLATTLFPFVTESVEAALARRLRPRERGFAAAGDDWDVATTPSDGETAVYTERPLHLEFRDGRFDAYFARLGRRVVLRLIDERGNDLFDRLEYLEAHATELPEYQTVWQAFVLGGCAGGAAALWYAGMARFTTLLETNQRYQAALVPIPTPVEPFDPQTVDWPAYPPLHRFTFRTSRWPNLTAHVAAHAVFDELARSADLGALFSELGAPAGGRRSDDPGLDAALLALGLPPRSPAEIPEIVRIWRQTPGGYEVVALLFDGPEPLVRDDASVLSVRDDADAPLMSFRLGSSSGTRSLLLFTAPGAFVAISAAELRVEIAHTYVGLQGLPVTEAAVRAVVVPPQPSFLDEEAP